MTDARWGGIASVGGAVGGLIAMGIQRSARDLLTPEGFEAMARLSMAAHSLYRMRANIIL